MPEIFHQQEEEEIVDAISRMLEEKTKKKIFTFKVIEQVEEGLESVVVMEDKSVLMGLVSVQYIDGQLACRMQLNYI